ncbi:hypothetical protein TELCIR_00582 [Teladorsagia circumcincta]|uniref:Uncharacterized protein n=1 Tax=Teladorsagia circumcincta TaxID=45464 RepID=A0A2G9V4D7_TELCI|nr:hypothetical protein TELCIR_00582 [Teladorsagia circumcincta]
MKAQIKLIMAERTKFAFTEQPSKKGSETISLGNTISPKLSRSPQPSILHLYWDYRGISTNGETAIQLTLRRRFFLSQAKGVTADGAGAGQRRHSHRPPDEPKQDNGHADKWADASPNILGVAALLDTDC